jgi:uncharacterized protein YjbJ (UPF0337 family)
MRLEDARGTEAASAAKETAMNRDIAEGKWKQITGTLREKWGKLTDDDVAQVGGKRDRLVGKVQERYGYVKDQAEREVDSWIDQI